MSRYKLNIKVAKRLSVHDRDVIRRAVIGSCKSLSKDHPEWSISPEAANSLAKRVNGQLSGNFDRLFADRVLLDWLERHRHECDRLSKLRGGLREVIASEIEEIRL